MALDEEAKISRLWRFDGSKAQDTLSAEAKRDETAAVVNGLVWSPGDDIVYTCNTPEGEMYQHDYDVGKGTASNSTHFLGLLFIPVSAKFCPRTAPTSPPKFPIMSHKTPSNSLCTICAAECRTDWLST
ncbi:hypothetical protein F5B21DRAFT_237686 [Xylaria acuta]|nr:hypothetical protein F5B21DRAFT_237686 [Xylaria acuta]